MDLELDTPNSTRDSRILQRIQRDFPVSADPYGDLARSLGCTREEVQGRVAWWRRQGLIRRLGPIYDPAALGRKATLCAVHCPASGLSRARRVLERVDQVTHAYVREARHCQGPAVRGLPPIPDLWFTLSAASSAALAEQVATIGAAMRLGPIISLPSRRAFKIRAVFDPAAAQGEPTEEKGSGEKGSDPLTSGGLTPFPPFPRARRRSLSALDRRVIAATQRGLPAGLDPYGQAAADLGLDREVLLDVLDRLRRVGVIRRVGAVVAPRRVGLAGNCLVAWLVPAARVEEVGIALAAAPAVSHCYERDTAPEWPYNVYSMVHAADEAACVRLIEALARQIDQPPCLLLFTRRELKKTPPRYV